MARVTVSQCRASCSSFPTLSNPAFYLTLRGTPDSGTHRSWEKFMQIWKICKVVWPLRLSTVNELTPA